MSSRTPDHTPDEAGLGNDIGGYTVGQCYEQQAHPYSADEQFDREIAERANVWNSIHD